jgi:hypothetical protein
VFSAYFRLLWGYRKYERYPRAIIAPFAGSATLERPFSAILGFSYLPKK